MTIDQIISILANGIPNGLGYVLFLYLFYETRKDNRDILKQTRDDAATRESVLKKDSENREMWFRQAVDKQQTNEAVVADSLRRLVDKMESVDERLQRIESRRPTRGD